VLRRGHHRGVAVTIYYIVLSMPKSNQACVCVCVCVWPWRSGLFEGMSL
jgi:hypothetical protein